MNGEKETARHRCIDVWMHGNGKRLNGNVTISNLGVPTAQHECIGL